MHYLVDAYNLLFLSGKKQSSLEKGRQSLIQQLNEIISQINLTVTLVFDGAGERIALPTRSHFDTIEIIYTTKGQTADEYISDEVFHAKKPSQLTIVTNDRELAARCRNFRAKTLTIDEFFQFLLKKRKTKKTTKYAHSFRESDKEIERLLKIFEKKLLDDGKES